MTPQPPSLVRAYLKTEPRRLAIVGVVVLGVAVIVTTGYVLVVGWDKWTNDMAAANHMMWAGYTPVATTNCPRLAAYTSLPPAAGPVAPTAPQGLGRQYSCPGCGTSTLPIWNAAGQPVCPVCGAPMAVATLGPGLELAAAP
jgi:hypothetical protein